jgi:hypothetical protein
MAFSLDVHLTFEIRKESYSTILTNEGAAHSDVGAIIRVSLIPQVSLFLLG